MAIIAHEIRLLLLEQAASISVEDLLSLHGTSSSFYQIYRTHATRLLSLTLHKTVSGSPVSYTYSLILALIPTAGSRLTPSTFVSARSKVESNSLALTAGTYLRALNRYRLVARLPALIDHPTHFACHLSACLTPAELVQASLNSLYMLLANGYGANSSNNYDALKICDAWSESSKVDLTIRIVKGWKYWERSGGQFRIPRYRSVLPALARKVLQRALARLVGEKVVKYTGQLFFWGGVGTDGEGLWVSVRYNQHRRWRWLQWLYAEGVHMAMDWRDLWVMIMAASEGSQTFRATFKRSAIVQESLRTDFLEKTLRNGFAAFVDIGVLRVLSKDECNLMVNDGMAELPKMLFDMVDGKNAP